jgi:hypothetical protein
MPQEYIKLTIDNSQLRNNVIEILEETNIKIRRFLPRKNTLDGKEEGSFFN